MSTMLKSGSVEHMEQVGDVLTKLQRLYGVINNEHDNLISTLQSLKREVLSLKDDHRAMKTQIETFKKENESLKKKNLKLETEMKTLRKPTTQQSVHTVLPSVV